MLGSAKDHALSLREDPSYFGESLEVFMQHQAKSAKQPARGAGTLGKAVKRMVADAYTLANM